LPLSDDQLNTKFLDQATLVIGQEAANALLDLSWRTTDLDDVAVVSHSSVAGQAVAK
jgi:hypothetical protein